MTIFIEYSFVLFLFHFFSLHLIKIINYQLMLER